MLEPTKLMVQNLPQLC